MENKEIKSYRVWWSGGLRTIKTGDKVFVGRCGSGRTVFGEFGTLVGATKTQLIFKTDSMAMIRTSRDNLHKVIGKFRKEGWWVSLATDREDFIQEAVTYWDEKLLCFKNR